MSQSTIARAAFLKGAGITEAEFNRMATEDYNLRTRRARRPTQSRMESVTPPRETSRSAKKKPKQKARELEESSKALPESLAEFEKELTAFRDKIKAERQLSEKEMKLAFRMLTDVFLEGGIEKVLAEGEWPQKVKVYKKEFPILTKEFKEQQFLEFYMEELFQFEYFLKGRRLTMRNGLTPKTTFLQPTIIRDALTEALSDRDKGLAYYAQELVVFRGGLDELNILEQVDIEVLRMHCSGQTTDIRIQNPCEYNFDTYKMTNIGHEMSIGDYCEYQERCDDENYKKKNFGDMLDGGKTMFAVNFEPKDLSVFSVLWDKIEKSFLSYREDYDLLAYLQKDIPGCSSPQFYMKVPGVWTGGHQQNVAMCAVNINHGPGSSQWYGVPNHCMRRLRNALKAEFDLDIYEHEGLWYQKIDWFIENGYPITKIIQKAGDVVISGPGTLHWVRSYGKALQSAWNIYPKNEEMLAAAFERHDANKEIKWKKSNIIPMKRLLLKYLDHQMEIMPEQIKEMVIDRIEFWWAGEKNLYQKLVRMAGLAREGVVYQPLEELDTGCDLCHQEILMYYVANWKEQGIACLECLHAHPDVHKETGKILYHRYNRDAVEKLLMAARGNITHDSNDSQFCNGQHIGQVSRCPIRDRQAKQDEIDHGKRWRPDSEGNTDIPTETSQKHEEEKETKHKEEANTEHAHVQTDDYECKECIQKAQVIDRIRKKKAEMPAMIEDMPRTVEEECHFKVKNYEQRQNRRQQDTEMTDKSPERHHNQRRQSRSHYKEQQRSHPRHERRNNNPIDRYAKPKDWSQKGYNDKRNNGRNREYHRNQRDRNSYRDQRQHKDNQDYHRNDRDNRNHNHNPQRYDRQDRRKDQYDRNQSYRKDNHSPNHQKDSDKSYRKHQYSPKHDNRDRKNERMTDRDDQRHQSRSHSNNRRDYRHQNEKNNQNRHQDRNHYNDRHTKQKGHSPIRQTSVEEYDY